MFCPKCGNQIADGAKFCPKCGNAIAAAPVAATPVQPAPQTASAASPVAAAPAHSAFDITRIVPAVPAVLAMVFACMPWIIVNQSVVSASNFVGGFAGFLTGTDSSAHSFAESYTPGSSLAPIPVPTRLPRATTHGSSVTPAACSSITAHRRARARCSPSS